MKLWPAELCSRTTEKRGLNEIGAQPSSRTHQRPVLVTEADVPRRAVTANNHREDTYISCVRYGANHT